MNYLGLNEIREKYLSFFESKGHLRQASFPLVPQNDKSLLLINSGMAPLKPFFTGQITPPKNRMTSCQKCIRTPDIENVGKTARHGSFFEMLGNFSFGDYFKKEATAWAWEFCTKVLELPIDKLHVTVYLDDDEAYDIWTKDVGVDPSHVSRLGKADNFWEIGVGPCGPCSEIYYDRGPKYSCGKPDCKVGCDCDRYVEFWNLVFTQYNRDEEGNYSPLEKKNIDTGMGLERIACIIQGVDTLFDIDTFRTITNRTAELSNVKYGSSPKSDLSMRIITDHIRSTTMMISDGVMPSNEGRGYVLRRLLRRAARHAKLIGIENPNFLTVLCDVVIDVSKGAYPNLEEKADYIKKVITMEEERFNQTIDQGLVLLTELIDNAKKAKKKSISGADSFKLYDTFGFPLDLTREILDENNMDTNENEFNELMKQQRQKARDARQNSDDAGWQDDLFAGIEKTQFVGYKQFSVTSATILGLFKDNIAVDKVHEGDSDVTVVVDKTPFYAQSGGQEGDNGVIVRKKSVIRIDDCKKVNDIYMHKGEVISGFMSVGDKIGLKIDTENRMATSRNHSSAHLLQASLRKILGDHVIQAGSMVDQNRLRFDFTHFSAMTENEVLMVESQVNDLILSGLNISSKEMAIDEARKSGAVALFGEKYGNTVRVVNMGGESIEFCGGTHLDNTAKIGLFKIISESGVAAGVRRIEALTGLNVMRYIYEKQAIIDKTAMILHASGDVALRAENIVNELKIANKTINELNNKIANGRIDQLVSEAKKIGELSFIAAKIDVKAEILRGMCDIIKEKYPLSVTILAGVDEDGKLNLVTACGKTAVNQGGHAGNLIKKAAMICGGGGGGRPDSATAGGKDVSKITEAFLAVEEELKSKI